MRNVERKLLVHEEPWGNTTGIAYFEVREGQPYVAKKLEFTKPQAWEAITPTFNLARDQVQDLFNELWRLGYRPKDGTGNSGHVEAIKFHLEDMRKLVFSQKKDRASDDK